MCKQIKQKFLQYEYFTKQTNNVHQPYDNHDAAAATLIVGVRAYDSHVHVHVADPNNRDITFSGSTHTNLDGNNVDAYFGIKYATQERFDPSKLLLDLIKEETFDTTAGRMLKLMEWIAQRYLNPIIHGLLEYRKIASTSTFGPRAAASSKVLYQ